MSDLVEIIVPAAERAETARRLLEAAAGTAGDATVVRTGGLGSFYVPAAVAAAAGLGDTPAGEAAEEAVSRSKRANRNTGTSTSDGSGEGA